LKGSSPRRGDGRGRGERTAQQRRGKINEARLSELSFISRGHRGGAPLVSSSAGRAWDALKKKKKKRSTGMLVYGKRGIFWVSLTSRGGKCVIRM